MKIQTSIKINAPVEKVFEVFRDLGAAEKNISSITKIEVLNGPAMMEVGTKWKETRVMFGQQATEEMEIGKMEKNVMYEVVADSPSVYYSTVFNFVEENGVTDVEMIFEGKPKTFMMKLMSPLGYLFLGATKKALHQDLVDLKAAIEKA